MNVKNAYTALWLDWIQNNIKNKKSEDDWKFEAWFYMSMMNATNYLSIALGLKWYFDISILVTNFHPLGITRIDTILNYSVQVAAPWFILSYFLFFYKERYKNLLVKNKVVASKMSGRYGILSIGLFFTVIILKAVLN